jgi:hypothetical protein
MSTKNKFLILFFCILTPIVAISDPDKTNPDPQNKENVTDECDFTNLVRTMKVFETTEPSFPKGTIIQVTEEDELLVDGIPTEEVEQFCQIEEGPTGTLYTAGYTGIIRIKGCQHYYTYRSGHGRNAIINLDQHISSPACNRPHGPRDNAAPESNSHGHSDDGYHLGQAHAHEGDG